MSRRRAISASAKKAREKKVLASTGEAARARALLRGGASCAGHASRAITIDWRARCGACRRQGSSPVSLPYTYPFSPFNADTLSSSLRISR